MDANSCSGVGQSDQSNSIGYDSSNQVRVELNDSEIFESIKNKHQKAVQERLMNNSNPIVSELYSEYSDVIKVWDSNYKGTAHYSPTSQGIYYNSKEDLINSTGVCSTYFHEVGHLIDDYAGNGHTWLSSEPQYREMLEADVKQYVKKVMMENDCDTSTAYDLISLELEGDDYAAVSDIFGSLTGCMCQGDWGHSVSYWQRDRSNVEKEAFANMFESSIGSERKQTLMKEYFPRAYSIFETIIRSR